MSAPAPLSPGRRFWPVSEAAQSDYEALRAHVLAASASPGSLAAARFARRGLPGLIAWPSAEPVFDAELLGAQRPPWSPHNDPRLDALAAGFALLLDAGRDVPAVRFTDTPPLDDDPQALWEPERRHTSGDLLIFVDEAAEAVVSFDLGDLGSCPTGERTPGGCLAEGAVRSMIIVMVLELA